MWISPKEYLQFYNRALVTDHTYHRARKELWDQFVRGFSAFPNGGMKIEESKFVQIKSYLCTKNDSNNSDDKRLAFETAIIDIYNAIIREFKTKILVPKRKTIQVSLNNHDTQSEVQRGPAVIEQDEEEAPEPDAPELDEEEEEPLE
jgi:hypothetical protein